MDNLVMKNGNSIEDEAVIDPFHQKSVIDDENQLVISGNSSAYAHKIVHKMYEMLETMVGSTSNPPDCDQKKDIDVTYRLSDETFSKRMHPINWDDVSLACGNLSSIDCRQSWKEAAYGKFSISPTSFDSDEEEIFDHSLTKLSKEGESYKLKLVEQVIKEGKIKKELKNIKFLVPEQIHDGSAQLVYPTFSSSRAFCLAADLHIPIRSLGASIIQKNPAYEQEWKRRRQAEPESTGTNAVQLFASLAASSKQASQGSKHSPTAKPKVAKKVNLGEVH
mmetsp:Transcript_13466/g.20189  ORF Transcript_13466/g.20189 Transcript_13466/m.20189 type:complete len:278 (-) Transcript_13466:7-840(-)